MKRISRKQLNNCEQYLYEQCGMYSTLFESINIAITWLILIYVYLKYSYLFNKLCSHSQCQLFYVKMGKIRTYVQLNLHSERRDILCRSMQYTEKAKEERASLICSFSILPFLRSFVFIEKLGELFH